MLLDLFRWRKSNKRKVISSNIQDLFEAIQNASKDFPGLDIEAKLRLSAKADLSVDYIVKPKSK